MQTLQELGQAVAERKHSLGMRQQNVATLAGITSRDLSVAVSLNLAVVNG